MKVNTTGMAVGAARQAMEREFLGAAGQLASCPKRRVRLPLDREAGPAAEVGYNGRMFLIRRGEEVELPLPLAEILEHAGMI